MYCVDWNNVHEWKPHTEHEEFRMSIDRIYEKVFIQAKFKEVNKSRKIMISFASSAYAKDSLRIALSIIAYKLKMLGNYYCYDYVSRNFTVEDFFKNIRH